MQRQSCNKARLRTRNDFKSIGGFRGGAKGPMLPFFSCVFKMLSDFALKIVL